jgi:hypothetical protein
MTIINTIAKELLESRVKFVEEMYLRFITEESPLRRHPIDFKNFIIYELEKEIKK